MQPIRLPGDEMAVDFRQPPALVLLSCNTFGMGEIRIVFQDSTADLVLSDKNIRCKVIEGGALEITDSDANEIRTLSPNVWYEFVKVKPSGAVWGP